MATLLASIYGTEKDKVNCSFYYKIGACRHGDKCSRKHVRPTFSQTVLLPNVYINPSNDPTNPMNKDQVQAHFDLFYEDFFVELSVKYGEIDEMNVCENIGDHLVGNVYVKFRYEDDAFKCMQSVNNRFYGGRPLYAELSPVTDFRESCCRQHENNECTRGGYCNFMHMKRASPPLMRNLLAGQREERQLRRDRRDKERTQ